MSGIAKLDSMKNLEPRTRKDGERRRTVSRQDDIGEKLANANTPSAMGKLAASFGVTEEEIVERGKKSPNFGQFRMVLGNRIRGIIRRREEKPGLSKQDAAYPPKRGGGKAAAKKKVVKKAVVKKVIKKAAKPATSPAGEPASV